MEFADGIWRYPEIDEQEKFVYPAATPVFPARRSWHDPSGEVDVFWGPSVHYNTALSQYVMLLNHAVDGAFSQEGIYVSASPVLDDPARWVAPQLLLKGGKWYPQVVGDGPDGTDRLAGETARLFISGVSDYQIQFVVADDSAVAR